MLLPQPGSSVRAQALGVAGAQVKVVQWTGFRREDGEGSLTFQVQLWEGGDIVIAYAQLEGDPSYQGGRAFIGLQSIDYLDQLLFSDSDPVLWPGQAIRYRHR